MKSLINKSFLCTICSIALGFVSLPSHAQKASEEAYVPVMQEKTVEVPAFTSLTAGSYFDIQLVKGDPSVTITADEALMELIHARVGGTVLFLDFDEKSISKELKKVYKGGKNGLKPSLKVKVSTPEINEINLTQYAVLTAGGESFHSESFVMNLSDDSQVKGMVLDGNVSSVNLKKNAKAELDAVTIQNVVVMAEGESQLDLKASTSVLSVTATGTAKLKMEAEDLFLAQFSTAGYCDIHYEGKSQKLILQASGSSKSFVKGSCEEFHLRSDKSAQVDALELAPQHASVVMLGSSVANVTAVEDITVNLTGGSTLFYAGTPALKIEKIVKSSMAPAGTTLSTK